MADFVAVLRKTIGALGDNTPEMREKVYDKARATIEAKLAALDPQPPAAVIERQRKALDDAIAVVRADYAAPTEPEKDEGLEDVFASLKPMGDETPSQRSPAATPPPTAAYQAPLATRATPSMPRDPVLDPEPTDGVTGSGRTEPVDAFHAGDGKSDAGDDASMRDAAPGLVGDEHATDVVMPPPAPRRAKPAASRGRGRTIAAAAFVVLLLVAGGTYAWINADDTTEDTAEVAAAPEEDVVTTAEELVEEPLEEDVAAGDETAAEDAPAAPAEEEEIAALPETEQPDEAPAAPVDDTADKFTQRLMPDGSEVDEGPAGGQSTIGEGTSVSAVAPPQDGEAPVAPSQNAEAAETNGEAAGQQSEPGIAVGQRAIFYEERTSSTQGSAELGSIVWSVVQESPGGDLPPEPAIRAEATIPGKDVQLRMTIRRNGDESLPAAHIIEMIFLTPEGFEGGAISNVSRVAFKETEQAAGSPLVGIPAKIADGFFLIALSDAPAETQNNLTLLRRQNWVDIPIVYQSGRRALLSLEKGIPGDRVFQEALGAWEQANEAPDSAG
ncbi:hypothetical protein [Mesorhizobium sp. CAU 1741]|uniref:hypothetical protein n=1 Tax=Mesorhizobium sp. CAU 1741 TaxID=3140366 RepID=UPI00325B319A